jgi:hypothetical protein
MAITILVKGVLITDGQSVGNITVGGQSLQARVRVFPTHGNLVAIQTLFPISDAYPKRSNWATHPKEWCTSQGLTAEETQFIAPMSAFTEIGWTNDERHDSTGKDDSIRLLGENPDKSLQFKIKDDGTVETSKNSLSDEQALINKYRQTTQQATVAQTEADKAKAEKESIMKIVKGVAITVGVLAFGGLCYWGYGKLQEHKKNKRASKAKKDND